LAVFGYVLASRYCTRKATAISRQWQLLLLMQHQQEKQEDQLSTWTCDRAIDSRCANVAGCNSGATAVFSWQQQLQQ
jgi:hypothetical protein